MAAAARELQCTSTSSPPASAQLTALAEQLVECARQIMDPYCPAEQRQQYQKTIDEFKEASPYCVECSLLLIKHLDPFLQHLGLQLLDHFIRYRWSTMQGDNQVELRKHMLMLMTEVGCRNDHPPSYVRENIARIMVEIIKRSWPQFWPSLQDDLHSIGQQPLHVELLLLVYRRLVEDLLSFDSTLSQQRKADMLSELQTSMLGSVMSLIITVMQSGQEQLQLVALATLLSLSEWIDHSYITADNCRCLVLLYTFTSSVSLQSPACDCLVELLSRKSDPKQNREHRLQFLKLFSKDAIDVIQEAAVKASRLEDETSYQFVKKACQVLVQLGVAQLAPLWDNDQFQPPDNFGGYLNVLLEFTRHPSQVLCQFTLDVWSCFTAHTHISCNEVFMSCLPSLLSVLRSKQLKVGDPTSDIHQSCFYSRMDFDGQLEHGIFFSKFKGIVNRVLTTVARLSPEAGRQETLNTAQVLTQQQAASGAGGSSNSPLLLLEWDGFVSYLECWTSALGTDVSLPVVQEGVPTGVSVLQLLIDYSPQDPLTSAAHLRALHGGLVMFVILQDQLLQKYLEKVLTCAVYPGPTSKDKFSLTRDERQVRLTALYCLNSVIKNHATAVLPASQQLFDHYQRLVSEDLLLYTEKCYFIEAFVLLSHFNTQEEQVQLLKQLLSEVHTLCDNTMMGAVKSLEQFVSHVGLNIDPTHADYHQCSQHRAQLCYCVHVSMGVLQKMTRREVSQCGIAPVQPGAGLPHPSYQITIPLVLQLVLPLIKTLHQLWSSHSSPLLSQFFQGIVSVHELEKKAIVGVAHHAMGEEHDEVNKVHHQLLLCYDQCIMAVGFAWVVYGPQCLNECGVVDGVVHNVFEHLADTLPLRIKPILRTMVVPMVTVCPPDQWSPSLLPILTHTFYTTLTYLQKSWDGVLQRLSEQKDDDEQQALSQEVLEYQFIADLTKQYSHVLEIVCLSKESSASKRTESTQQALSGNSMVGGAGDEEMEDLSGSGGGGAGGGASTSLSNLALCLLDNAAMQQLLRCSVSVALTWRESASVRRCCSIAAAIVEKTPYDENFFKQLFEQVLLSLQIHGADESIRPLLLGLALQLYQLLVSRCPDVVSVVTGLPGCSQQKVLAFNNGVLSGRSKPPNLRQNKVAKWTKDEFKKLMAGIIGKPIGQLYKKPPPILDLPDLVVRNSRRRRDRESKSSVAAPLNLSQLFSDQHHS